MLKESLKTICNELAAKSCNYGIIGGLAIQSYKIFRETHDIDLLIEENQISFIKLIMNNLGYNLDFENHEVLRFKKTVRVDFLIAVEPWMVVAIKNSTINKDSIMVVNPLDLIAIKFRAMQNDPDRYESDLKDVCSVIDYFPEINIKQIKHFAKIYHINEFLS